MTPKMGKIDIDYQVLHDAFFKYQTKPKMTGHGDLYYEGKEFEVDHREKKPGVLSAELKAALGMQDSAGGALAPSPPPWLINMQRYGPPPSYPNMRIPGLSAPIPEGASYGYHPGGWGKPPVDEYNRPLYGDVFGTYVNTSGTDYSTVDRSHWGELEEVSSSEDEEESDNEEDEDGGRDEHSGAGKGTDMSGTETPLLDGISSVASGLETPDTINLRKHTGTETPVTSQGNLAIGIMCSYLRIMSQVPPKSCIMWLKSNRPPRIKIRVSFMAPRRHMFYPEALKLRLR